MEFCWKFAVVSLPRSLPLPKKLMHIDRSVCNCAYHYVSRIIFEITSWVQWIN